MTAMSVDALLAAANRVKAVVEAEEAIRFERISTADLEALPHYQTTVPTSPRPGFRYKRMLWRNAAGLFANSPRFEGYTEPVWFVYTCVAAEDEPGVVLHQPREAKVTA